jgi:O-antigen ligase
MSSVSRAFSMTLVKERVRRALPVLYIAMLCLIYLVPNIWTARTLYNFIIMPLALVTIKPRELSVIVKTPAFLATAIYFLLLTAAGFAAPDPSLHIIGKHVLYALLVLSFLVVTAALLHRGGERFIQICLLSLALAAAIEAAVNIAVYYHASPGSLWTNRLQGIPGLSVYYNSNVMGDMYAVAFAASAAHLARCQDSVVEFALGALSAAILLLAVLLTGSRGALLGTAASAAVLMALCASWRTRIGILLLVLCGVIGLYFLTPVVSTLAGRADSFRLLLWPAYVELAAKNPWLGYGLTFNTTVTLSNGVSILNAHDIYLSAMIRGGFASAIALLVVVVASIHQAWRGWRVARTPLALGLLACALAVTAVDYEILATPLGWPWVLLWFPVGTSLGVGAIARQLDEADPGGNRLAVDRPRTVQRLEQEDKLLGSNAGRPMA